MVFSSVTFLFYFLPIGISFYTFQMISYVVDVYRGEVNVQKNILKLAIYVSLFPQLIAVPIVRYSTIEKQLENREYSINKFALGVRRFVIGLGKKVMIANVIGTLVNTFLISADKSVLFYWLYAIGVMLQIYFDFSGYSDMAIGLGKMFGFEFLENFNYPYIATSITDFWRRWHISLSSWFRDYVYIPFNYETKEKGKVYDLRKYKNLKDKYDIYLSGPTSLISIENPNADNDKELLLFKDSFGSSIAPLLIEHYRKITLIDLRYINSECAPSKG